MARTLVSLRAEVRRREELLAAYGAADLPGYESLGPVGQPLPHLVIIIDEFRMLVDEAPEALAELMRVAAIGRSLGIHLIMATQRPQGAVSADIRANVTSCIALRVQSELESIDIINSRLAAAIPITRPGRAYLVRGNEAPEEFQTATVTPPLQEMPGSPTVMEAMEFLNGAPAGPFPDQADGTTPPPSQAALTRLTEAVAAVWEATGSGKPRRPVAEPLPGSVPFPADGCRNWIRLGLLDLPGEQRVAEFGWHPGTDGHLGLIPGLNGGADEVLQLIVDQLLTYDDEAHVYILDAAGAFSAVVSAPRVGAVAGLHELRRAARVLERISEEMARRLSTTDTADPPVLVLALCGWGSWVSAFRSGPLAWAEDLVLDIVRDGARAGITVLVAGERELVTSRFFASIPNRVFLPDGSTEEWRLAWPRLPAIRAAAGRVVVFGPISIASSLSGHVGQRFEPVPPTIRDERIRGEAIPAARTRPFRIEPLPQRMTVAEVRSRAGPGLGGSGGNAKDPAAHRRLRSFLPARASVPRGRRRRTPPGGPPFASRRRSCRSRWPCFREELAAVGPAWPQSGSQLSPAPGGDRSGGLLVGDPRCRPRRGTGSQGDSPDGRPRSAVARNEQLAAPAKQPGMARGPDCRLQPGCSASGTSDADCGWPGAGGPDRPEDADGRRPVRGQVRTRAEPSPGRAVLISDGRARAVQLAFDPAAEGSLSP